jgi:hypothetical protein
MIWINKSVPPATKAALSPNLLFRSIAKRKNEEGCNLTSRFKIHVFLLAFDVHHGVNMLLDKRLCMMI